MVSSTSKLFWLPESIRKNLAAYKAGPTPRGRSSDIVMLSCSKHWTVLFDKKGIPLSLDFPFLKKWFPQGQAIIPLSLRHNITAKLSFTIILSECKHRWTQCLRVSRNTLHCRKWDAGKFTRTFSPFADRIGIWSRPYNRSLGIREVQTRISTNNLNLLILHFRTPTSYVRPWRSALVHVSWVCGPALNLISPQFIRLCIKGKDMLRSAVLLYGTRTYGSFTGASKYPKCGF